MNLQKKLGVAYVLFGIGFAFVIFGFILYITPPKYKEYTEEEIINKARSLGMEFIKKGINTDQEKENKEDNNIAKETDEKNGNVEFVIEKGESSSAIVNRLFEKEIIEDKVEFDNYLKSNNLSTKLQYGKYNLRKSMDYNELTNIITIND